MKKKYLAPEVEDLVCLFEEEIALSVQGGGSNTDLTIGNETEEEDWDY